MWLNKHLVKFILFTLFITSQFLFAQKRYMPNGGLFTPKGEIKALVVFVGFSHNVWNGTDSIPFNHQPYDQWDIKNGQELPPYINMETGEMDIFHDELSDFDKKSEWYNISSYYNEMSLGKFKFMADVFKDPKTNKPVRIDIDPKGTKGIATLNKRVLDEIYNTYPNFDWAKYDQRENSPNYLRSTNDTRSDGKPDCIILVYRNDGGMQKKIFSNRLGWGGGVASSYLRGYKSPWENIRFDNTGYTLSSGDGKRSESFVCMFLHEIAHKLYDAPHYNGANGAIGCYFFYPDAAYGMMNPTNFTNLSANGWERWALGWINLNKNNPDFYQSIDSINGNTHSFIIRDFVSTGDAIRLPIPHYPGQFLWLENHQNYSKVERGPYAGKVLTKTGDEVPKLESGIYAYIENLGRTRHDVPRYGSRKESNAIRLMNANGNWDYSHSGEIIQNWQTFYNNPVVVLKKEQRNMFSGTNPFFRFVDNYAKGWSNSNKPDENIKYSSHHHGGYLESTPFILETNCKDTVAVYGFSGGRNEATKNKLKYRNPFYQDGDELSISAKHPIYGLKVYDKRKGHLFATRLNGMRISFQAIDKDAYLVKVTYNDFVVKTSGRWSGDLMVKENYINKDEYSLILDSKVTVTLNKSGTVNRHLPTPQGDFIKPSELMLEENAKVLMKEKSRLIIEDGSILRIKRGATLEMKSGSRIITKGSGQVIIEEGAVIQKESGAKIVM